MSPPKRRPQQFDFVCAYCGSDEVSRDAWADWDAEAQRWVLGAVFDYAHCHACERETSLLERTIGANGNTPAKAE